MDNLLLFPGVSVSVSCFTLVAISLERYFAICKPLHSRSWQTLSHAYLTIAICWVLAGIVTIPIGTYTRLRSFPSLNVCREFWTSKLAEKIYTISLDNILLLFPIVIMSVAYGKIVKNLWEGIRLEAQVERVEYYKDLYLAHEKFLLQSSEITKEQIRLDQLLKITNEGASA
ncbi:cholecystokinin receptor-like [Octopus sinensis]|uniref:Cholecystokinin receptor-like n=1 Tax=Octopus sinensis TaxID=2607531 RepID=A0A7E6EL55_9MOLL|nr:cholecystokinin receptor-like [Octopus sinensis]